MNEPYIPAEFIIFVMGGFWLAILIFAVVMIIREGKNASKGPH